MRFATLIGGAAALGPILGVMIGGSINTVPKQAGADVAALLEAIPRHPDAFDPEHNAGGNVLPDHYPLVTPRGTVQVADLWLHGLYRNKHPARFESDFGPELYEFEVPEIAQEEPLPNEQKNMAGDPAFGPSAIRASGTVGLLVQDQVPQSQAGPKVVDVAAVLARK